MGKNRKKVRKKLFLYSHEYRDQKTGTKKSTKQFIQKHTNSAKKMLGQNRLKKMRKKVFCIHTNIVTIKWGKKRAEQFFQ